MKLRSFLLALAFVQISALQTLAWNPGEALQDPALEARARNLSAQLRCLVCQNQSIDDSDADLARDLRLLVRERISAGDSDNQVIEFLVQRYGEFVLLKPRFSTSTFLLWGLPLVALGGGAAAVTIAAYRRRKALSVQEMSDEEKARIAAILDES